MILQLTTSTVSRTKEFGFPVTSSACGVFNTLASDGSLSMGVRLSAMFRYETDCKYVKIRIADTYVHLTVGPSASLAVASLMYALIVLAELSDTLKVFEEVLSALSDRLKERSSGKGDGVNAFVLTADALTEVCTEVLHEATADQEGNQVTFWADIVAKAEYAALVSFLSEFTDMLPAA